MIVVVGIARLQPGSREAMAAAIQPMVEASLLEDGCLACVYGFAIDGSDAVTFHEVYRDMDALRSHFVQPHLGAFHEASRDLMLGRPQVTMYGGAEPTTMS